MHRITTTGEKSISPSISFNISSQLLYYADLDIILPYILGNPVPSLFPNMFALVANKVNISSRSPTLLSEFVWPIANKFYKKTRELSSALCRFKYNIE